MSKAKKRPAKAKARAKAQKVQPQAEVVQCWDELKGLYGHCAQMLMSPAPIVQALTDRNAVHNSRDQGELVRDSKILHKDMETYKNELQEIYSTHAERTGGTDSPDELLLALTIGERYQEWISSFQSVVTPIVTAISDNILNKNESVQG